MGQGAGAGEHREAPLRGGLGMRAGLGANAAAAPAEQGPGDGMLAEDAVPDAAPVAADVVSAQQAGLSWRERAAMLKQQRQGG